jgi:hypothetical protein
MGRRPEKAAKLLKGLKHVDLNEELILGGDRTSPPPSLRPPVIQITQNIFCDRFRHH